MKKCRFDPEIRCFWPSCDFVDSRGNIRVCKHFLNPFGRFRRRKVSPVLEGSF